MTENVETEQKEEIDAAPIDERELKIKQLEKEVEDFKGRFYYSAAEHENTKKRFEREKENLLKFGNERVLSALIGVIDNLERTTAAITNETDEKVKNIAVGVDMVQKQFLTVLKDNGLVQLQSLGEIFNPNYHEALTTQKAEGKKDQEIVMEYQKGYLLNGRLLRPAKVVVAKND